MLPQKLGFGIFVAQKLWNTSYLFRLPKTLEILPKNLKFFTKNSGFFTKNSEIFTKYLDIFTKHIVIFTNLLLQKNTKNIEFFTKII